MTEWMNWFDIGWLKRRKADAKKNMRIVQKMALGYLMLVLLPILGFGVYLYDQSTWM